MYHLSPSTHQGKSNVFLEKYMTERAQQPLEFPDNRRKLAREESKKLKGFFLLTISEFLSSPTSARAFHHLVSVQRAANTSVIACTSLIIPNRIQTLNILKDLLLWLPNSIFPSCLVSFSMVGKSHRGV